MLAAILLNLPDYQQPGKDADAAPAKRYINADDVYNKQTRSEAILTAARRLEELTEGVDTPAAVKPVAEVLPQIEQYAENRVDTQELSSLLARLAALEFELRQKPDVTSLLVLQEVSVVLTFLRDDEEAILAILLCEA
jgi:hypothetical protein